MPSFDQENSSPLLDELQLTLEELAQATENLVYLQQAFHSLKNLDLRKSQKQLFHLLSSTSLREQFKQLDLAQITSFLESPLVQKILTDPEFLQLFAPDSKASFGDPKDANQNKD